MAFIWDIAKNEFRRMSSGHPLATLTARTMEEVIERVHPDDQERFRKTIEQALADRTRDYRNEFRIYLSNGECRYARAWGQVETDANDNPTRLIGISVDVTDQIAADEALRESELRFSTAFNVAPVPMAILTLGDGRFVDVNEAMLEARGLERDELIGKTGMGLGLVVDRERFRALVLNGGPDNTACNGEEFAARRKDGTIGTSLFWTAPITVKGQPHVLVFSFDITERKRAEEQIRLLLGEVNHRAKNLLAVVESIASRTAQESDPLSFSSLFTERILGLAASHDLLVRNSWSGVELGKLVQAQLSYLGNVLGTRVVSEGEPVQLKPDAAQTIGIALHELATNASKYGALSTPTGRISIEWRVDHHPHGNEFCMTWREVDGPIVRKPQRYGFGHSAIVKAASFELGGEATLEFQDTGVRWTLRAPAENLAECRG